MPGQLLRTVKADLWWREKLQKWLDQGQIPADCVSDLRTSRNRLSVFEVQDEQEAEQVVAALALQRAIGSAKDQKSLGDEAGMLFSPAILTKIGIQSQKTTGQTRDDAVNARHMDLVDLSGAQLVQFAQELVVSSQPQTFYHTQLLKSLKGALDSGRIAKDAIPARVQQQIAELKA